jgi:hypothetical protein
MGAVLVPVILVLILLVLVWVAVKRFSRQQVEHSDRLQYADRPTLRYAVPPGQDVALVLTELKQAGFDASPDSEPGPSSPILIIGSLSGEPDREAVRRTLAQVSGSNIYPPESGQVQQSEVKFLDET